MRCPWCVAEGERSTITPEGGAVTAMGWSPHYDEDGWYHTHDPNGRSNTMLCSRGHRWAAGYSPCGVCGWGRTEDRLIEVRCPGSGSPVSEGGKHLCPSCEIEQSPMGCSTLTAGVISDTTWSIGTHFVAPQIEATVTPLG